MLPKNSKHYIQPAADDLNISYEFMKDVIDFYYSKLRKNLSDLSEPNINIENLGIFKADQKKLKNMYIRYNKHLEVTGTETMHQMRIRKHAKTQLNKITKLQDKIIQEGKRRDKVKEIRKQYEEAKRNQESTK
jgi:hypothetical protein